MAGLLSLSSTIWPTQLKAKETGLCKEIFKTGAP